MTLGTPTLTALLGIKNLNSHLVPCSSHINITCTNGCADDYPNRLPFHICQRKTLRTVSQITPEFETLKCNFTLPIKLRHVYFTFSRLDDTVPNHQVQDNKLVHGHEEDLPGFLQKSKDIGPVGEKAGRDKRRAVVRRFRKDGRLSALWSSG